jgi:GDSL-like Lipase/Acylhydrolase family
MFVAVEPSAKQLDRRASSRSPLVARLLLTLASSALVVLALVGAELLARGLAPGYLVKTRGLHVFSRTYGWAGRPGAVAPMGAGRATLNARGYRGPELALPKARDRTRVVVLGDSIAFGYGVADEQTFTHLLDIRNEGLEVVNLGVEGYGPGQELLVLRRDGLPLGPDVVVLAVCLRNDFVDAVLPVALYDGVTPRPRFRLEGDDLVLDDGSMPRSAAGRALRWLSDESHLFNRLSAIVPRGEGKEDPGWRQRKQEVLRDQDYAFRLTFALVMEMEKACRRRRIAFLVATFPSGLGYGIRPELSERFHESLRAEGVGVVDMGARFRARGLTPAALAIDRTGHLGPRGHAETSEILEREIAERFGEAAPRVD